MSTLSCLEAARSGRSGFAHWRRANPAAPLNFSQVDFTAPENRRVDFSGCDLGDSADFSGAVFGDTPISFRKHGSTGTGTPDGAALFNGSRFGSDACFRGARFGDNARFDGASFTGSADFSGTTFGYRAEFEGAVFGSVTFNRAVFGDNARLSPILVLLSASFGEVVFGQRATFKGASFPPRTIFHYSAFGREADFEHVVFAGLVQFEYARFGDHAIFREAAFSGRAIFDVAEFGDFASFDAGVHSDSGAKLGEHSKCFPEEHAAAYLARVRSADPALFREISFSGATFRCAVDRNLGESTFRKVVRWPGRLLHWSPYGRGSVIAGARFNGRTFAGFANFSRVRFEQPPSFADTQKTENLDLSFTTFGFRAFAWPYWRNWTTQTSTATTLRRLRKLAADVHAQDAERDLFILERMAERGIAWSVWWSKVTAPWDFHRQIQAPPTASGRRLPAARLSRIAMSFFHLLAGAGRPLLNTLLVFLYRILSDFGRSMVLPGLWLVASMAGFGTWYGLLAERPGTLSLLATFSLANAVPFVGNARAAASDSAQKLFAHGQIPAEVHAIGIAQGLVSALLIFLFLLALRNYFRVR